MLNWASRHLGTALAATYLGAAPGVSGAQSDEASATGSESDDVASEVAGDEQSDEASEQSWPKFVGVPVPTYNPQFDFSLGLLGMLTYPLNAADKVSPPSSTMVFGMYTTNGSWLVAGGQSMYWAEDDHRASVIGGYADFNTDYYGTGDLNDLGLVPARHVERDRIARVPVPGVGPTLPRCQLHVPTNEGRAGGAQRRAR